MNLRPLTLLCAFLLLAAALPAQAPPTPAAAPTAAQPGAAAAQPPRRVPEGPYKEVIPPSPGDLTVWPRGASPQEIGKALAEHFINDQATRFSGYPMVTWGITWTVLPR